MANLSETLKQAGIITTALSVLRESDAGSVWMFTSKGGQPAVDVWRKLRKIVPETGHWPVILGAPDEVGMIKENFEVGRKSVKAILNAAGKLEGKKILADRERDRLGELKECNPDEDEADYFAPVGKWPKGASPNNSFAIPIDSQTGKPLATVAVALAPTPRPWEVPAFLGLGGWNECPIAAEHVAVMKRWNDLYDAEIVGATRDVIEFGVGRPPTDRKAAIELAREQYIYCNDIVDQGTETLSNLAAGLLNGSTWFFWWD